MTTEPPGPRLRAVLGGRQMSMIAIGGTIGAGLFVGSGSVIHQAGPASLVAYVVAGLVVILVMRMLAELSVATPTTGSFASYASRWLGSWAGLAIGWLYAYSWSITVGVEAVVGGGIVHGLVPAVPAWSVALVAMIVLTGSNLLAVRAYGELEFWFALIKVVTIVLFLAAGVVAIAGLLPGVPAPGLTNLTGNGGFAPHGWLAIVPAGLVVMFSFEGSEVVTIAAGEARRPAEAVRRAIRSTTVRILAFYIGSVAIVVTLLPATDAGVTASPYAAVLDRIGVPAAGLIMEILVVVAVLSCLNSGIYASSRMLFALAGNREAPGAFGATKSNGVPVTAILVSAVAGFATVAANYFLPTTAIFDFLTASSGSITVILYLCIAATQLRSRAQARRAGQTLTVRMWWHPYLTWAVVVGLCAAMVLLVLDPSTRTSLVLTLAVTAVAVLAGLVHQRRRTRTAQPSSPSAQAARTIA